MSNFLQPHGLQHARLPCPSLSPGVCANSCSLSQWCHPTISSCCPFFLHKILAHNFNSPYIPCHILVSKLSHRYMNQTREYISLFYSLESPWTWNNYLTEIWHNFINRTGLPWWLRWQRICLQCKRSRFDSWVGKNPWRRKWQPTPIFLPGELHRQRSLVGYSPWGHKESAWLSK